MGILEDKSNARLFYKYLSKVYDRVNRFNWTAEMRAEALSRLEFGDDDRVLDVGCGTGFGTEGLLDHADDVHGLDQSVHQIEKAFEKFGKRDRVRFYRGDAERLPFRDDAFDIVWSSGSIEYWPNPVKGSRAAPRREAGRTGARRRAGLPAQPRLQRVADAIMLFYDEAEADRMFEAAGYDSFEHHIQRATPRSPRAITTVARVPDE
jgi:Methylase involved in ubiquinone/menaquinone biosynthesis